MSATDILRNLKVATSYLFTEYKKPAQLSSYIARVNKELGYKFTTRTTEGGVWVSRIPNTGKVTLPASAPPIDISEFF